MFDGNLLHLLTMSTLFALSLSKLCIRCFSVTVLQFSKGLSHTLKILLYLYINIELIF